MNVTRPFSNGTEERAWQAAWCEYCTHDHEIHDDTGTGCDLILNLLVAEPGEVVNEEAWVAEPDDGAHFLPSRMICLRFAPCHQGACTGDPGAAERAERIGQVSAYWRGSAGLAARCARPADVPRDRPG